MGTQPSDRMTPIPRLTEAVRAAESQGAVDLADAHELTGYSGLKLIGALQRLASVQSDAAGVCYLEIGVFRGLTLLSVAAANPTIACFGIDNFAFFDRDGKNLGIVTKRRQEMNVRNANIINLDYEDALADLTRHAGGLRVATYFVDGPHDYRSQLICLELALPHLHDHAVIVVDDANYNDVRQANRDFLTIHPEYALLFEAYTPCHPSNMTGEQLAAARAGWWNGVNILVHDPHRTLQRTYPPSERSRLLFENDRIVHSANIAESAPRAIRVGQLLAERRWLTWLRESKWLYDEISEKQQQRAAPFADTNTYSASLPESRYAPPAGPTL
jgi:hypothetical protein